MSFSSIWDDCFLSVDTSVLVNVYRLPHERREGVFSVLEQVRDRLWLPHQVGIDYHRAREGMIEEGRPEHYATDAEFQRATHVIRNKILRLFVGRVGRPFDDPDQRRHEAAARVAARIPPMPAPSGHDDRWAPVFTWLQLLEQARTVSKPCMFITARSDWFFDPDQPELGARAELTQEMRDLAGVELQMYSWNNFIAAAAHLIDSSHACTVPDDDLEGWGGWTGHWGSEEVTGTGSFA